MSSSNNYPTSRQENALASGKQRTAPLHEAAYHGITGEYVRMVEPHTEADPAGILVQFLVAFGFVIGRNAHFKVEATEHHPNIFAVMVGASAKARKGTSWDHIKKVFENVEGDWSSARVKAGLSSGEGLIHDVRDATEKKEPVKEKGVIKCYQSVIVDPGEGDKRLLVVETEFARTLKVMARETSTLSPILRQAWDNGNLQVMTKEPCRATSAHISVIGHITAEELTRYLTDTETANGFANRFLWVYVQRSKLLSQGGQFDQLDLSRLVCKLREAVSFAKSAGQMLRDPNANSAWDAHYGTLSRERAGLVGSITSRAEAHVLRLSMIYALLDGSAEIQALHLQAAIAVWDYVEQSITRIFGGAVGDPVADAILAALPSRKDGMTRTDISVLLGRNYRAERISAALNLLLDHGLVISSVTTDTGGRPAETWQAVSRVPDVIRHEVNEQNELPSSTGADSSLISLISSPAVPKCRELIGYSSDESLASEASDNAVPSPVASSCPNNEGRLAGAIPAELETFTDLLEAVKVGDVPAGNFILNGHTLACVSSFPVYVQTVANRYVSTRQRVDLEELAICQAAWRKWKSETRP